MYVLLGKLVAPLFHSSRPGFPSLGSRGQPRPHYTALLSSVLPPVDPLKTTVQALQASLSLTPWSWGPSQVGMIASHPGRKRQGPPHCCQQDASTLQFALHSTILARPELILRLLFFLQSGCLAGLQGGRELCWAWWSRNTERLQLSPHFRVRFHSSLPADSFPWLSDRKPNSAYPMVNAQAAACSGSSPHGPLAEGEAVLSNQVTPRVMLSRALSFRPWDITNNTVQGLSCGSVGEGRGEAETLKVDAKILTCAFFLGRAYLDLPWETECFTTLKMSEPWIWCSPHSLLCKSSLHMLSV